MHNLTSLCLLLIVFAVCEGKAIEKRPERSDFEEKLPHKRSFLPEHRRQHVSKPHTKHIVDPISTLYGFPDTDLSYSEPDQYGVSSTPLHSLHADIHHHGSPSYSTTHAPRHYSSAIPTTHKPFVHLTTPSNAYHEPTSHHVSSPHHITTHRPSVHHHSTTSPSYHEEDLHHDSPSYEEHSHFGLKEGVHDHLEHHVTPKYTYDYSVQDEYSGVHHGKEESRDGYDVEGSYHVLLPDGRKQIVTYYVKGDSGFVAEVSYEGEAKYPDHHHEKNSPVYAVSSPRPHHDGGRPTYDQTTPLPHPDRGAPHHISPRPRNPGAAYRPVKPRLDYKPSPAPFQPHRTPRPSHHRASARPALHRPVSYTTTPNPFPW